MKIIIFVFSLILLCCFGGWILPQGCGDQSQHGEMSGQVLYVEHNTPLICTSYTGTMVSSGVIHNGTGSMSSKDYYFEIPDSKDATILREAARTGQLVEIYYNIARFRWCLPLNYVTSVRIIE